MSKLYVSMSPFTGPHCDHNGYMVDSPRFTGMSLLIDSDTEMSFSVTITPPVIPQDATDVPSSNCDY